MAAFQPGALLNLPPISLLPQRSLPSEADYLCLKAGGTPAHCKLRGTGVKRKPICQDEGGCQAENKPCCLFKLKERWSVAGFPMKERDDHIVRVLDKINKKHAAKKKAFSSSRLKEEDRVEYIKSIQNATINLAPDDFQSKIMGMALPNHMRRNMIDVMNDYLSKEGSRYVALHIIHLEHFLRP